MPPSKRVSYSNEQKSFWIKLFYDSDFTGKDSKQRFLIDDRHRVIQGLYPHVHDDITRTYRIWNTASEESIVECFKKSNCMRIVVSEEAAAVPASVEPGSLNNDSLDDEI